MRAVVLVSLVACHGSHARELGDASPDGMQCPAGPSIDEAPAAPLAVFPPLRFADVPSLGTAATTACVDTSALPAHAALDALVPQILDEAGLAAAPPGCACDWSIVLSASAPSLDGDAAAAWAAAGDAPERYAAVSVTTNGRAVTTLYAPSERAALYAVRAAMALYQQSRVAVGTFVDWPSFAARGVLEGIYGPNSYCDASTAFWLPWRVLDRTEAIRLASRTRLNTFIYGPKCDHYSSPNGWSVDYPASEGQVVATAAHVADEQLVDFVWSVRPLTFFQQGTYAVNLAALKTKLDHVRALGVRHFALFWDDSYDYAGTVAQQIQLMNDVDDYVRASDPTDHLIVVGQPYCGPPGGPSGDFCSGPDATTDAFGTGLHPEIEILWTGPAVEPATIAAHDLDAIDTSYRRHVSLWDNWPCAGGAPCPGSHYTGRSADLPSAAHGIYINPVLNEYPGPANPPRAFMQVVGDIAAYTWDAAHYAEPAADAAWQPLLARDEAIDGACRPCNGDAAGWTCGGAHEIHFCDFDTACETVLPCPGGCESEPPGEADVCH
ncbi:MAG: beta-N-acetylglucosaminidase domain-containing protein [Deltaproteobacteria bacterium]|nr:beta-N-acetylglucosaminidase domain-containing protein [Deltaproteobacteria bacterium]